MDGVLDLTGWDFEKDGPVELKGEWHCWLKEIVNPQNIHEKIYNNKSVSFLEQPGRWTTDTFGSSDSSVHAHGYMTLALRVVLDANSQRLPKMALSSPWVASAHELFLVDQITLLNAYLVLES